MSHILLLSATDFNLFYVFVFYEKIMLVQCTVAYHMRKVLGVVLIT